MLNPSNCCAILPQSIITETSCTRKCLTGDWTLGNLCVLKWQVIDEEIVLFFFSPEIVPRDAGMKGKFIQHFTGEESDTKCISTTSNVKQLAWASKRPLWHSYRFKAIWAWNFSLPFVRNSAKSCKTLHRRKSQWNCVRSKGGGGLPNLAVEPHTVHIFIPASQRTVSHR